MTGTMVTVDGRRVERPTWVDDLRKQGGQAIDNFSEEVVTPPPREVIEYGSLSVTVVYREDGDIIFQIFPGPKSPLSKDGEKVRNLLAETIECYFGSTDRFEGSYTDEMKSWALKAVRLSDLPSYNHDYHVVGFVKFLSDVVDEWSRA